MLDDGHCDVTAVVHLAHLPADGAMAQSVISLLGLRHIEASGSVTLTGDGLTA